MKHKFNSLLITLLLLTLSLPTSAAPGRTFKENNHFIYTIEPGDTFYKIAQKFNLSIQNLQEMNPDLNPLSLVPGDKVKININPNLKCYIVNPGDSLWKISKNFDYPLSQVINRNQLKSPDELWPEEVIIIPEKYKYTKSLLYFLKYTKRDAGLVPEERKIIFKRNLDMVRYE